MKRVEDIFRPLVKGELLMVPCIVKYEVIDDYEYNGRTGEFEPLYQIYISPVFNLPHSDKNNGQEEIHYHLDYRFIKTIGEDEQSYDFPTPIKRHSRHVFGHSIRPLEGRIRYFSLIVIRENFVGITPPKFIKNSKLKHKCIHKGKCPHKRYDLSQVSPKEGVIQCPLHGLKFNSTNKKLIN